MSVSELSAFHVLVIGAANVRYVRRSRFDGCRIADMRHMRPLVGYLKNTCMWSIQSHGHINTYKEVHGST